jgi:hypothetical protein
MSRAKFLLLTLLALFLLGAGTSLAEPQKDPLGGGKKTLGEELARNPKLTAKLQPLLPEGMDIAAAAKGFKKIEQFASALHAALNLRIPFDHIKARMIAGDNLVKAIRALDPTVDAKAEAKKAEDQAREDIKS